MAENTRLLPCPFCGSNNLRPYAELSETSDKYNYVSCQNCGAMGPDGDTRGAGWQEEAAKAWNTRAPRDTIKEDRDDG